jgi:hypothetical protein
MSRVVRMGLAGQDDPEAFANIKEAIAAWLWAEDGTAAARSSIVRLEILVTL